MNVAKLFGAAAILALAASPAKADHQWGNYHWANEGNGVTLTVRTIFRDQTWSSYYTKALAGWVKGTPLTLNDGGTYSGTTSKKCNPISGGVLVCSDAYGFRGWLGIATIWADASKHITAGTTKLNDSYFNSATYNKPAWRRLVACQEIGHDFGLAHQDETFGNVNLGSCMDYTNAPAGGVLNGFNYGASNEHPNSHDTAQLNTSYGHTDGYSTNGAATNFAIRQPGRPNPPSLPDPGDSEAEWGTAVHHDGKGRPDQFVRRLANGGQMITHVFWALDVKGTKAHADDGHAH